jgi:hypothetical protein
MRESLPLPHRLLIGAGLIAVLALMAIGCARDRYEVTTRQSGDQEQLVRVDKTTGKTEVLAKGGWVPVGETKPALTPPKHSPLPSEEVVRVQVQQFTVQPDDHGRKAVLIVSNGSTWDVHRISAILISPEGRITKDLDTDSPGFKPAALSGYRVLVRPGQTQTLMARLADGEPSPTHVQFAAIEGFKH